jgi:hypothetical protein
MDLAHEEAKRPIEKAHAGARWFAFGGVGLLAAAGGFLWMQLALEPQYLLALAAAVATALGLMRMRGLALIARAALLGCCLLGGALFAGLHTDALLVGLVVAVAGATVHALVSFIADDPDKLKRTLTSHTFALAALLASGALYFRFVTLGLGAEHVGRRLVLTLAWLATGIVLVVVRAAKHKWHPGYLFVLVAVGEAMLYDTVQLSGTLRVATLGLAGALLLGGAWLLSRGTRAAEVAR